MTEEQKQTNKSGDIILLYADSAFDITFKVLDKLKRGQ